MKNLFYSKFRSALLFCEALLIFFVVNSPAQIGCELIMKSCLDYNSAGEINLSVPLNSTWIAKDSIKICLPSLSTNPGVDLVFAVDQSQSMLYPKSDPMFLAPQATTRAINAINKISPSSNAGYLGFSNGICDGTQKTSISGAGPRMAKPPDTRVQPAPLSDAAHLATLLGQTNYNSTDYYFGCGAIKSGGTNYYRAIQTAQTWLSTLTSPNKDVIIFLTDGVQTSETELFTQLVTAADASFPSVYVLFLSNAASDPDTYKLKQLEYESRHLINLTKKTGGNIFFIEKAELVDSVMQKVVRETIGSGTPAVTSVSNTANNSTSHGANHIKGVEQSEFRVTLDNFVALNLNANLVTYTTTEGTTTYSKNITINADTPAIETKGRTTLANDLFDVMCYDQSLKIAGDKNYSTIFGRNNLSAQVLTSPSRSVLTVRYALKTGLYPVSITIYNHSGKLVKVLFRGFNSPGKYRVDWNISEMPAGAYRVILKQRSTVVAKTVILL